MAMNEWRPVASSGYSLMVRNQWISLGSNQWKSLARNRWSVVRMEGGQWLSMEVLQ